MDVLRLLQTIGICIGSVALVATAVMVFFILRLFVPRQPEKDEDPLRPLRGRLRAEIQRILTTPLYDTDEKSRSRTKKNDQPPDRGSKTRLKP